ncbi:MAG: hypothetical protein ACYDD4_14815, partial [Acidimicrobiales bacterium]
MKRPTRIDQVVHVLAVRDAIGSHVLNTREVIRRSGYSSDIYADVTQPDVAGEARALADLDTDATPDRWLLVHHSTGARAAEAMIGRPEPMILDYHNITPPELIDGWMVDLVDELELGQKQLFSLARQARFGIVHSEFSRSDLHHAGCASVAVVPPLGEFLVGDVPDETAHP